MYVYIYVCMYVLCVPLYRPSPSIVEKKTVDISWIEAASVSVRSTCLLFFAGYPVNFYDS